MAKARVVSTCQRHMHGCRLQQVAQLTQSAKVGRLARHVAGILGHLAQQQRRNRGAYRQAAFLLRRAEGRINYNYNYHEDTNIDYGQWAQCAQWA